MIDELKPTGAYDLLTPAERQIVDEYVEYAINKQNERKERIALAINYPIPPEFSSRSRGLILKPLPRAALAERIKEEGQRQDLSPDTLIKEYYNIAYSNVEDYFKVGDFGELVLKDWDSIPREKLAAIKKVNSKMTTRGIESEVILHDKRGAMDILAKLMGMVASEEQPLLEEYATDKREQQKQQDLLNAPADAYAAMLEEDE